MSKSKEELFMYEQRCTEAVNKTYKKELELKKKSGLFQPLDIMLPRL
jgi:hypothetical protein